MTQKRQIYVYDAYFVDKQQQIKNFNLELDIQGLFLNFGTENPTLLKIDDENVILHLKDFFNLVPQTLSKALRS